MSGNLAFNIKRLIDEQRLSVMGLEKKAGLKTNAVRNILSGHTKKPSAETVLAISKALGCSISQIIGELQEEKHVLEDVIFQNEVLFRSTVLFFLDFYKERDLIPTSSAFLDALHNIYKYLNDHNNGEFDAMFAQWFLTKKISSKNPL